ncbi:MAG: hypothetical protein HOB05_01395 [Bacteroidetes bacterium]|jgi:uncharacterized protein (TIGR02646 family)|nr:hypothetical protein [Bacteroidota bacterium]MBT6684957.1 hypothetical protein [Bacteroidota bacterium]MBT7144354.1 hypothetical protein [Bacteroidota bacterium]
MRYLKRLLKPEILVKKEQEWTEKFLISKKKRPDNSKYGHTKIKEQLNSMSFHKCFYCETKLKNTPKQIDHYIEISERADIAFDWNNLYLSCTNCNSKIANKEISVNEALNPCKDSDNKIQNHLTFENEIITAKNNSEIGLQTIKKFRLDSNLLDNLRAKQLIQFQQLLVKIFQNKENEGRKKMNKTEIESLVRFSQVDYSFSLMFRILLQKFGIVDLSEH